MTTPPTGRLRRPSEEVQTLILDAARELFAAKGYTATTTKEIAVRAGVSEPLVFSNFGSKARLFEVAITGAFTEFVEDYIRSWRESDKLSELQRLEGFIRGLIELTDRHRGIIVDAISASSDAHDSTRAALISGISGAFQQIHSLDTDPHPWTFDPTFMLAASHGMVMGTVLLDQILFPADGVPPERETLVSQMATFMLYGLVGPRCADPSPSTPGRGYPKAAPKKRNTAK